MNTSLCLGCYLVVFLSSLLHLGSSQHFCGSLPDNPNADREKQLMDSYRFEHLLPGNGTGNPPVTDAVWNDYSFDGNDANVTDSQTYWQQLPSSACRGQVKVCGWKRPGTRQNNWLFTQHISQDFDPNTYNYQVEIQVTINFALQGCQVDKGCVRGFNVWNYPTNETQLPSTQGLGFMNTQNYDQIVEIRKEGRGNVSPEEQITFIQSPSATGFYVGIQDVGGCVSITRLRVYRNNCKSRQLGLVLYPDAPAPVSNSANIDVSCVENAVVSGSAVATCASNGTWGPERPVCQCQLGYIENLEPPECNACPAGQYRSEEDTTCQPCPGNTLMTQEAAPVCQCLDGYFRNNVTLTHSEALQYVRETGNEKSSHRCTKPPSAPESVTLAPQQTRITVSWSPPAESGGRTDLYYQVEHSDPNNLGSFTGTVYLNGGSRSTTFSSLSPFTPYCVRVTAHNGVSDQDPDGTHLRANTTCGKTKEKEPGPVQNLVSIYPTVLWQEPLRPNGDILNYHLTFTRNGTTKTAATNGSQTFFVTSEESLPEGSGSFTVEVSAVNGAGVGESLCRLTVNPNVCSTEPQMCTLCEEKRVGLVRYPATAAPEGEGSVVTVTTECVENAEPVGPSLEVTCSSGGVWGSEQPQCKCTDNFKEDNETGSCTAAGGTDDGGPGKPPEEPTTESSKCPVSRAPTGGLSKDSSTTCKFPLTAVLISCAATAVVVGLIAAVALILVVVCFKRKLKAATQGLADGSKNTYCLEPAKTRF